MRRRYLSLLLLCMLAAIGCRAKNSVAPMTAGYVFMLPGDAEVMAQINLTNWGDTRVTSFTYTLYYMDSKESEGPMTVALDTPLEDGETHAVGIAIKAGKTLGKEDVLLNITQVNGTYNEASVSYTYITRCTVNKMPVKRVLVEDYAAMWCWHCPVGLVATDALARRFPDDVVAVSVHKTDDISKVVSPTVYEGLIDRYAATLPAVWIARDNKAAGYDVTTAYQSEKSKVTYMNIGVSARWDATGDAIDVTAEVEPCMTPEEGSSYSVGYVLTASGLTNPAWRQEASYAEYSSPSYANAPEEMKFYADAANYSDGYSKVKGVVYNHVAIESKGMERGIANSLGAPYAMDEVKKHSTTFSNISRYGVIGDKSKIEIVAVLFNNKTNKIENAARCRVDGYGGDTTGIGEAVGDKRDGDDRMYDMMGRRVYGKPAPGLYIVNGRKIIVK